MCTPFFTQSGSAALRIKFYSLGVQCLTVAALLFCTNMSEEEVNGNLMAGFFTGVVTQLLLSHKNKVELSAQGFPGIGQAVVTGILVLLAKALSISPETGKSVGYSKLLFNSSFIFGIATLTLAQVVKALTMSTKNETTLIKEFSIATSPQATFQRRFDKAKVELTKFIGSCKDESDKKRANLLLRKMLAFSKKHFPISNAHLPKAIDKMEGFEHEIASLHPIAEIIRYKI